MDRTLYTTTERTEANIPLQDLLGPNGVDLYPEITGSGLFTFTFSRGKLMFHAGNQVGFIPLNDRVALVVEPKISRVNWLHVVEKAEGFLRSLPYLQTYAQRDMSRSIAEFLSRAFLDQMLMVYKEGLLRGYRSRYEVTARPRGRILPKQSIEFCWSRGRPQFIAANYFEFSADNPHNRLLKVALSFAIEVLADRSNERPVDGWFLTDLENLFAAVPLDRTFEFLREVVLSLERGAIPPTRSYYFGVCKTALLIAQHLGITPDRPGHQRTLSFVVNMEVVFEKYCYACIRDSATSGATRLRVSQQPEANTILFERGTDNRMAAPDILVTEETRALVVEVKYKFNPSREDINQAVTYGLRYGTPDVVIICLAQASSQSGWEILGSIGGITISVYRINLTVQNLDSEERQLADAIFETLRFGCRQAANPSANENALAGFVSFAT